MFYFDQTFLFIYMSSVFTLFFPLDPLLNPRDIGTNQSPASAAINIPEVRSFVNPEMSSLSNIMSTTRDTAELRFARLKKWAEAGSFH